MEQTVSKEIEGAKNKLQEIIKPYQREQNQRQKKADFLKKCVRSIDKNDFFQLDELLKSKQAKEIMEDSNFQECDSIFSELQEFVEAQIDLYQIKLKGALLQLAEETGLPLEVDFPRFSVLKGIEGELDVSVRKTIINQTILKSIDPKRIISTALKMKRTLYDSVFDPQKFIDSLLQSYKKILKETGRGMGGVVPIHQLYHDYVWSLQSKSFLQNMDKGKFKGYSIEQFAVDFWRFFKSSVTVAEGGYQVGLNPGRGKSFWLIDHNGEKRQITHARFVKK